MTQNRPAPRVEILPFPPGKRIAVTASYDDGVVEDRRVVEYFNRVGIKGTFNLNSGVLGRTGQIIPTESGGRLDASEIRALYAGHEVAIHTVTHPHLPRMDDAQAAAEVLDDRRALEDLVGYPVRGMAYPFGTYDDRIIGILRALGVVYARTVENAANCFPPKEPLAWPATFHQFDPNLPASWEKLYADPKAWGRVFFVWGHSYEFARRNDWPALERIFGPIAGKSDVWYCTNIELFDYESARKHLVIAANRASAYNPSALTLHVSVNGQTIGCQPGKTTPLS